MMGRVHLVGGQVLTLEDDGVWTCNEPLKAQVDTANAFFNLRDWSPGDGRIGYKAIEDAAEFFDGTAEHAYEPGAPDPNATP